MSKRFELRALYMDGWYEMDAAKLLSSTTEDFIFDDPAEPLPVTRSDLVEYMVRWERRARAAGSTNQWALTDEVRVDRDGILTDWEWWRLVGTDLQGAAVVKTSDAGVFLERITYFSRKRA